MICNTIKARKEILQAVQDISAIYPEGEPFFDALDNFLINTASPTVYKALFELTENRPLVLSGGFGKRVAAGIDSGEFEKRTYILFKGGLRKGNSPEILKTSFTGGLGVVEDEYTFIDDTIYGGNTYYKIKDFLADRGITIKNCVAVYDGCPKVREDVSSIFRYYDHFKNVTPNFAF